MQVLEMPADNKQNWEEFLAHWSQTEQHALLQSEQFGSAERRFACKFRVQRSSRKPDNFLNYVHSLAFCEITCDGQRTMRNVFPLMSSSKTVWRSTRRWEFETDLPVDDGRLDCDLNACSVCSTPASRIRSTERHNPVGLTGVLEKPSLC